MDQALQNHRGGQLMSTRVVGEDGSRRDAARLTVKGRATRERIVQAASDLMLEHGAARTTVEDVQRAAQVSASQLYHYFADKSALISAVVEHQSKRVLDVQHQGLDHVDNVDGLRGWRDLIVGILSENKCVGGCPIGSLASDLAENDPLARVQLIDSFAQWEALLRKVLTDMKDSGELRPDADLDSLALGMLAAVQGGLLLSQVRRDTKPLEAAVDTMIDHIRSMTAASAGDRHG
jgi:TetR/AcrR family transcriptional regulator, transcriptional repressor for nem operon